MKKILIIQTAYIGDVILATALIEQTKRQFPNATIDFVLRNGNESLLQDHKDINRVYIWNKKQKYKSMFKLIKELRSTQYDFVLNIQRFFNSGIIGLFSKAKIKVCFDKNPLSFFYHKKIKHMIPDAKGGITLHEVQRNAKLLQAVTNCELTKDRPKLYFTPEEELKIKQIINDERYFVLAPSSVWFTKQLPKEKWIELLKKLPNKAFLIGAPSDREYLDSIILESKTGINVAGDLSLKESALLMKSAIRVFVNDSAPLHLASSVNAKTTAFFCSTIPEFGYGPLSDDHQIIETIPREKCSPCGLHGKKECPLSHFKCGHEIDINKVTI